MLYQIRIGVVRQSARERSIQCPFYVLIGVVRQSARERSIQRPFYVRAWVCVIAVKNTGVILTSTHAHTLLNLALTPYDPSPCVGTCAARAWAPPYACACACAQCVRASTGVYRVRKLTHYPQPACAQCVRCVLPQACTEYASSHTTPNPIPI